jgi:hypothetical protein
MKQHETEKENGYWMPDYIGTDMNLLLSEKVVLGIIVQYYKKYKKCFLGNDYFMPYLSTQRDATVSETLKSLAKKGYITIEKGNGKRLLIPIPEGFEKHFEITDSVKNDKKEVTDSVKSFTDSVKEVTDSVKKITLSVTEYNSNYKEKNIEKKTSPYPQISEEEEGFKKVKILESEAGNDEMEAMIKFILDFFKSVKSEDKAWLTKQIKKICLLYTSPSPRDA